MVVHFICTADGSASPFDGGYLLHYDPEAHKPDGSYDGGLLETTKDPAQAQQFSDIMEALEAWRTGPTCPCHALRCDGKPNRPLTAFTIEVMP